MMTEIGHVLLHIDYQMLGLRKHISSRSPSPRRLSPTIHRHIAPDNLRSGLFTSTSHLRATHL